MSYLAIKHLHVTFATLSITLFILRGIWMMLESDLLRRRWARIVPHVVDTVLLGSAITMVVWSGQYPFVQHWLTAKVIALVVYIVLGAIALKRGKTKTVRIAAFAGALLVFSFIVTAAMTKQVPVFG